ncbi:MAG: protein translocase subunit SecD [Sandaracinus sp.]|nr:protein translocase subunit SecD [Sandaracinus sp.]|tara:strand:- start:2473 stop:4377 length:1905 start_codon:yes stop_codon:yes gene_type:complete
MDRSWYLRFTVVILAIATAWFALWPSLDGLAADGEDIAMPAPQWVRDVFPGRINPGLDIKGGLRLMYEVEVDEYIRDRRDRYSEQMVRQLGVLLGILDDDEVDSASREKLAEVQERVTVQRVGGRGIRVTFADQADRDRFDNQWISDHFNDLRRSSADGLVVDLTMREDRLEELRKTAVEQAVRTVSDRIDTYGLREATVIGRETEGDLIVEVPGADEASFDTIRELIARTARLEFKVLDDEATYVAQLPAEEIEAAGLERRSEVAPAGEARPQVSTSYLVATGEPCDEADEACVDPRERLQAFIESIEVPDDHQLIVSRLARSEDDQVEERTRDEESWRTYYVFRSTDVSGEDVADAAVTYDQNEGNRPVVSITFNSAGATKFEEMTGRNVKRRMAIVLDDRAESAPVIQTRIGGGRAQITLGSMLDYNKLLDEANQLVVVLRAGALPAPLSPANEQLIGPTLGRDSVAKGATGALVGVGLVILFMLIYYQVAGLVADVMVVLNLLFLLSIMAAFEATLTLPGVAAIALTIGMAVDANVLITERIREELRQGKSTRSAVDQGFKRAFWSVFDSQVTTFIAGVVLFQYGTGPIKGFAVMLMIGIVTSLFTGIFCSKVFFDWIVRGLKVERLRVG